MKQGKFWLIIVAILLLTGVLSVYSYTRKEPKVYAEEVDQVLLTVDDRTLTVGDLAYYIIAEEQHIEQQARIYDMEDTNRYWSIRLKGMSFLKSEARRLVIETAVHDEIFYQMAKEKGVILDEDEQRLLESRQYDIWSDLTEEQQAALGVTKKALWKRMGEIALAQKYQIEYGMEHSVIAEDYEVDGEGYAELLKEHHYHVNETLWGRLPFGNILYDHRKETDSQKE